MWELRGKDTEFFFGNVYLSDKEVWKPFYITKADLSKHMTVVGSPSHGKSNAIRFLLEDICMKSVAIEDSLRFTIFCKKDEYAYLQKHKNVLYLKAGQNFAIDLFDTRDKSPEEFFLYLNKVINSFLRSSLAKDEDQLSISMETVFESIYLKVFKTGKDKNWKEFETIFNKEMNSTKSPDDLRTYEALKKRLRLIWSNPCFTIKNGLSLVDVLSYNSVVSISNLNSAEGRAFTDFLLLLLQDLIVEPGIVSEKRIANQLFVFEDAHKFIEGSSLSDPLTELVRTNTAFGVGAIYVTTSAENTAKLTEIAGMRLWFNIGKNKPDDYNMDILRMKNVIEELTPYFAIMDCKTIRKDPFKMFWEEFEGDWVNYENYESYIDEAYVKGKLDR